MSINKKANALAQGEYERRSQTLVKALKSDQTHENPLAQKLGPDWENKFNQLSMTDKNKILTEKDSHGDTVLHAVAKNGNSKLIENLNPLLSPKQFIEKNSYGETPLHYAVTNRKDEAAKALVKSNPASLEVQDNSGRTPVHYAARNNSVKNDVLEQMIKVSPKSLSIKNNDGNTVLHEAAEYGNREGAKSLIKNLSSAQIEAKDNTGHTAYQLAHHIGNDRMASIIAQGKAHKQIEAKAKARGQLIHLRK